MSLLDKTTKFYESLSRIERLKHERNLAIGLTSYFAIFPIVNHFTNIKYNGIYEKSTRAIESILFPVFGDKSLLLVWGLVMSLLLYVAIKN